MAADRGRAPWAWGLPLVVLALGGVLGTIGAHWLRMQTAAQAQAEFERSLARVAAEVHGRFRQPVYGLTGARGLFAAHDQASRAAPAGQREVSRAEFAAHVNSYDMLHDYPGVRGFGFIEPVPAAGADAWVARQRDEGAAGLTLRQLGQVPREVLHVIRFIEPAPGNEGAPGLDVGSEPVRLQGLPQALQTGEPTTTGAITLVQDRQARPGVLLYLPLYGDAPGAGGAATVRGLLYAPIVIDELLRDLGDVTAGQMRVQLFDTASGTGRGPPMFDSADPVGGPGDAPRFHAYTLVSLPGRIATLSLSSTPAFEARWVSQANGLLAGSIGLGLLLAALLRQQITGRARAESLAHRMTADLQRLALVARRTTNAVVITDARRRITWVNEGFERLTGYPAADAVGRSPGQMLQCAHTDPATVARMREALDAGQPFEGEILNRGRGGRDYWLQLEIQPVRNADGAIEGFMAIEQDITERRRADAALQQALRDNEALLSTVHAHAIVSVTDAQGVIVEASERFCLISGYARDELVGRNHRILNAGVQPRAFWTHMWQTVRAGRAWRGQVCNRAKDGSLYWVDSIVAPLRGPDGAIDRFISLRFDITPLKHATQALADERARLARIIEGTGAGTWELDLVSGRVEVNDRHAALLGLDPGALAGLDRAGFAALVHPDDLPAMLAAQAAHTEGRTERYEAEFRFRHADGRWLWTASHGQVSARDAEGRALRLAGIHRDVSNRREMQQRLQDSHVLLSTLVENLPCAVSVFDSALRLVMCNAAFRRLLELPDTLLDRPGVGFEDIARFNAERGEYGPGDVETLVARVVERARRPAVEHRFERVRPNGLVLDVSGAPMPGGGFVTTYTDVTALRQAEAEARRSDELLRSAIDVLDEAFVIYDPEDRLVLCNEKYRRIYAGVAHLMLPGETFETIVRAGVARGDYLDAIGREEAWLAERLEAHRASDRTLVQRLDGGRTLRIVERKLADGHIVGFRIDITELVHATEAAEQTLHAKSRFLANMSHEIRTPMNAVLGMLALLRRSGLDARQAEYAAQTERAARSLLRLLDDILDYSKADAGKMDLEPHPFRIDRLLRDLAAMLAVSVGGKPVELLFDIDPALPPVLVGDTLRLQQVLMNLAGNAIKFTAEGEVVVAVQVEGQDARAVRLHIAVEDTGIGIAPEMHAAIFSGFTQAEASTTRRFGGTGLGLAISQRLVALMGGELALDSVPGHGSCFRFTVELARPATGTLPQHLEDTRPARLPDPLGALRVLLADDHPRVRRAVRRSGRALGWRVETVSDGTEALARLQRAGAAGRRYDAVFLDAAMPGMDGWETAAAIRAHGLAGDAPVVAMVTAHDQERLAGPDGDGAPAIDATVLKPVIASLLADAVRAGRQRRGGVRNQAAPAAGVPGRRRLAGLRLLLVEDNLDNQRVARAARR